MPEDRGAPGVVAGIPAYNEEETIGELASTARDYADEVVVVDDGSADQTAQKAASTGATLLRHEENQGYGATLGTIFQYAHSRDADHLVILDADGQHDPEDIPALVATQRETEAEVVTGSRFVGDPPPDIPGYRRVGLFVINSLTNLALRIGYSYPAVTDSQCGFRAYDDSAIATMATAPEIGSGMGASLDILFQAAREEYDIAEVPTRIDYDVDNASSRHPVTHGLGLLQSLALSVLRDRPGRVAAAVTVGLVTPLIVGLILHQTTTTIVSVLATALLSIVLLLFLPRETATRSERTDQ
nr:glycosyltransferase family 2 protein [Halovenus carboxidivorans]